MGSTDTLHVRVDVLGGDVTKIKSAKDGDFSKMNEAWSASVKKGPLYPISAAIRPIWELVETVDQSKGQAVREYLENDLWKKASQRLEKLDSEDPAPAWGVGKSV